MMSFKHTYSGAKLGEGGSCVYAVPPFYLGPFFGPFFCITKAGISVFQYVLLMFLVNRINVLSNNIKKLKNIWLFKQYFFLRRRQSASSFWMTIEAPVHLFFRTMRIILHECPWDPREHYYYCIGSTNVYVLFEKSW